ncbi:PaaI family thioesterase [Xanthobacter dioxanivorans]|uniref:Medium/long-chain acyl-CoA thioesterase YigI n=1 Tax=Xanthobacter dioxanivorans TaxID=2528964 RepID=A0A974PMT5_9HYPH|nr:PaaI family thioesterase [Xanthobacter dioxanivorans]QRG06482.1 PaaI family thioesterase [Xanthobacter dioxanivorans]
MTQPDLTPQNTTPQGSVSEAFTPRDPAFETKVRESFARQPFMATLGAVLGAVVPGRVEVVLPYAEGVTQQHGFFHGGSIGAIADTAGGYAAFTLFPPGSTVLTVEYKINIMSPGKGERLVAVGEVTRAGRTLTIVRVDVYADADGARTHCATATQTLICLHGKSDGPAAG